MRTIIRTDSNKNLLEKSIKCFFCIYYLLDILDSFQVLRKQMTFKTFFFVFFLYQKLTKIRKKMLTSKRLANQCFFLFISSLTNSFSWLFFNWNVGMRKLQKEAITPDTKKLSNSYGKAKYLLNKLKRNWWETS